MRRATIIIRNYNGEGLLRKYLPSVINALEQRSNKDEVIVVDDGSTDASCALIKKDFPQVKLLEIFPNSGSAMIPFNKAVRVAKHDVIISLDNDVYVEKDFINPLLTHFDNKKVFAVAGKIYNPDNNMSIESINYPIFYKGRLTYIVLGKQRENFNINNKREYIDFNNTIEIGYAPGNASAFNRKKLLILGGWDEIYKPIYCEENDICYRGWKKGWITLYEPNSVAYHYEHKTVQSMWDNNQMKIIKMRNLLCFNWRNLTDPDLLIQCISWAFLRFIFSFSKKDLLYAQAFLEALIKIPKLLKKRHNDKINIINKDRDILLYFNRIYNQYIPL
ncbi:MAG: glycosyltransferase family 2 protein [bacterium]